MSGTIYPADAVSSAPSYTGRMLRNSAVAPLVAAATSARPLGSISGIRPGTANPVTASSTTWTVTPFAGIVDGEAAAIAGPYLYSFNANQTGSVTAAAGSARIDRLDVQISDPAEGDGTGAPAVAIVYTAGTAGSGVASAAPARSHLLAYINVPASGGGSPTVTFNAPFSVAAGGILPTPGSAGYPASAYVGQYVDDAALGVPLRYNGTAWAELDQPAGFALEGSASIANGGTAPTLTSFSTQQFTTFGFTLASGVFTATYAGRYRFTVNASGANASGTQYGTLQITKNISGTPVVYSVPIAAGNNGSAVLGGSFTKTIQLAANDTISFQLRQVSGSTNTMTYSVEGFYLGPARS